MDNKRGFGKKIGVGFVGLVLVGSVIFSIGEIKEYKQEVEELGEEVNLLEDINAEFVVGDKDEDANELSMEAIEDIYNDKALNKPVSYQGDDYYVNIENVKKKVVEKGDTYAYEVVVDMQVLKDRVSLGESYVRDVIPQEIYKLEDAQKQTLVDMEHNHGNEGSLDDVDEWEEEDHNHEGEGHDHEEDLGDGNIDVDKIVSKEDELKKEVEVYRKEKVITFNYSFEEDTDIVKEKDVKGFVKEALGVDSLE